MRHYTNCKEQDPVGWIKNAGLQELRHRISVTDQTVKTD